MFWRCAHTEPKAVKNGKPVKLENHRTYEPGLSVELFLMLQERVANKKWLCTVIYILDLSCYGQNQFAMAVSGLMWQPEKHNIYTRNPVV